MSSSSVSVHYELAAYICGAGCIKPSPFEGWATFAQIFGHRPDSCRYAVARPVPIRNHQGKGIIGPYSQGPWLVWDLYHDDVVRHQRHKVGSINLRPPPATWSGLSKDGMIMKACMLYEES